MITRKLFVITVVSFMAASSFAQSSQTPRTAESGSSSAATERARNRLEELFIWKTSEELKLPPEQEQKFSDIIRNLGARKKDVAKRMDQAIADLSAAKGKSASEKSLASMRAVLKEYQSIQLAEFDQLKALIGAEKLARYYVVKDALNEKLKAMISAPAASPQPSASAPQSK